MPPVTDVNRARIAAESRSGLDPWVRAELPVPPNPRGLAWIGVVGPGVIVLGVSIGSGEFLLGPAVFVRYGLSLLWVTASPCLLQTIFNTELMRYTLATGEPVVHRLHAHAPLVDLLGVVLRRSSTSCRSAGRRGRARRRARSSSCSRGGWPARPTPTIVYLIGVGDVPRLRRDAARSAGASSARSRSSTGCWSSAILGSFLVLALVFVPAPTWGVAGRRAGGLRHRASDASAFFPPGVDFVPARRARRVLGRRRRHQHHAVELGARQGLRHGRARRLHSGGGRRHRR